MAKRKNDCEPGQFGPVYNVESAALKKFRRNGGNRKAYGQAVLEAILSSQRQSAKRADVSIAPPNCASGTHHSSGADILKDVARQQRAKLRASVDADRRNRTPCEWQSMYDAAMAEKQARLACYELPKAA